MARALLPLAATSTLAILSYGAPALAVDCFIDSVAGVDGNSGLTEDQPVQSQAAIPSTCTVAKFKRGSQFNEQVTVNQRITTYTNYGDCADPLPRFWLQRSPNNGGMFQSFAGGVTIDGLRLEGSMSDASMSNLMNGICVMLGSNSRLLNSEITNCDIGVMLSGSNNLVQGNYIHDLYVSVDAAPGVDPNAVGGAEGIFINGSDNEIAYNSFIRCSNTAEWTGGNCDGGATEVTVGSGGSLTGVRVHHNFAYKSCGFFEVSSMAGGAKGTFADSAFYDNVSVDSGWLMLLQVNNTDLTNIRWENNTVVHHQSEAINPGMLVTVFTATSSGMTGGSLAPNSVFLTNDLFILDGFGSTAYISPLDPNLVLENTLTVNTASADPGVVNLAGHTAADFDLVAGSPAIDQGAATARTPDFLNRTAPAGAAMDVGAFEYGAALATGFAAPVPADQAINGCAPTGGATGTGGSTGGDVATGGTVSSGGATATGGGGTTTTCTLPLVPCGATCVDLDADAGHCGACGVPCGTGTVCSAGSCTSACAAGLSQCDQSCVDLATDVIHCGACATTCRTGQTCAAGSCTGTATSDQPVTTPSGGAAAPGAKDDPGCGCVTAGATGTHHGAMLGLLLGLGALAARRRRGSGGGLAAE